MVRSVWSALTGQTTGPVSANWRGLLKSFQHKLEDRGLRTLCDLPMGDNPCAGAKGPAVTGESIRPDPPKRK